MTDHPVTQHQPAMKVGGRRLSVTTKKVHHVEERNSPETEEKKQESTDYPRPSPTTQDAPAYHDHAHGHYEEEIPHKKEKKQNPERKMQEYAHRKSETTRPTKDLNVGQKPGLNRISQPSGKSLNA